METAVLTLTDFLLARIAEDEAAARAASPDFYHAHAPEVPQHVLDHVAHHSPVRVLGECEAKRMLMQGHKQVFVGDEYICEPGVLRMLSLPYADHPDYREEWKP